MAAGAFTMYHNGLKNLLNGNVDFLTDTIKCALLLNTYTPAAETDDAWDDVSAYECADVDYAKLTLSSKAISASGGIVAIDGADLDYGSAVTITAKYLVVYKDSGVASTSYLIGYMDLDSTGGGDASSAASPFRVRFHSLGMAGWIP